MVECVARLNVPTLYYIEHHPGPLTSIVYVLVYMNYGVRNHVSHNGLILG
jgi:hypothetical protein